MSIRGVGRARNSRSTWIRWAARGLEDKLGVELRVEGLARTDAGCAIVVAHSVVEFGIASNRRTVRGRRSEVDPVEDVEHLGAELYSESFENLRVFEDGEIDIAEAGPVVRVST